MIGSLKRLPLLATVVCAFIAGCAPIEPANRVQSRLVDLRVDLPPAEARALAGEADEFLDQASAYLGARKPRPTLYVFRSGWALRRYLRKACPTFSERSGACFEADDGRLVVAVRAASAGRPKPESLRHELTHAVIGSNFERPMPWIDEAFAQMFESGCPPVEDKRRIERLLRYDRAAVARRLKRLLRLSEHARLDKDDYLFAWGFAWFLLQDEAFGKAALLRCLEPPIVGEDAEQRCERHLGKSRAELTGRFCGFLKSRRGRKTE